MFAAQAAACRDGHTSRARPLLNGCASMSCCLPAMSHAGRAFDVRTTTTIGHAVLALLLLSACRAKKERNRVEG